MRYMTAWELLCVRLHKDHRAGAHGLCRACSRGYGYPVPHPCPRAALAAPTIAQLGRAQDDTRGVALTGRLESTEPEAPH